jgi:hypothetical protein
VHSITSIYRFYIGKHFGIEESDISQACRRVVHKIDRDKKLKRKIGKIEKKLNLFKNEDLAIELAPKNIRVNSISSVAADTPMFPGFVQERHRQNMDIVKEATLATIPLGRLAEVEDVAKAALYLASDDASMVTGVDLFVDGGRSI